MCPKDAEEWQTVKTLIRSKGLIWVFSACPDLSVQKLGTLQSLYNATRYNTVLVITRSGFGSQIVIVL